MKREVSPPFSITNEILATAKRCLNKLVKENILEALGEYKARKYIKK